MKIDLTKLMTNQVEYIDIDESIDIEDEYLKETSIRKLKDVKFEGTITKLYDGDYEIDGKLYGKMILPDDITLEDVEVNFDTDIEEKFNIINNQYDNNLKIIKNILDIKEFLWQNILVEIPMKVVNEQNKNITLEGNGWRLITEEELKDGNKSPFSELKEKFNMKEE